MKKATPAQVGGGDPRVVAHPSFRKLPECLFPLRSKQARKEYATLAQLLFDAGRLTLTQHRILSGYAAQFDTIALAGNEGRPMRGNWFEMLARERRKLDLDDLDKPVAAAQSAPVNTFALCGFACRSR